MKAGDWVTTFERKYDQLAGKYTEADVHVQRIEKRTAKTVKVPRYYAQFKASAAGEWSAKTEYYGGYRYLRPSTPEEIAQGEAIEREAAEKAQQRKDAANAIRRKLPGLDWSAIDDATVERIEAMVQNPANHVKPVQMIIGKGKR